MRLRTSVLIVLFLLVGGAGWSADAQVRRGAPAARPVAEPTFGQLTQQELNVLLADVGAKNPEVLKNLAEDRELRRSQLDNLRQLLAFASQARKDGLSAVPLHARELKYIRDETVAVNYDGYLNKGKDPGAPFDLISDARVRAYFGELPGSKLSASTKTARATSFQQFLDTKVALLVAGSPQLKDRQISDEETQQARTMYAKINIYADEYAKRSALLPRSLHQKVNLQVKLQQAQFLARLYSEKVAAQTAVSEQEVAKFVEAHPEYDLAAKRMKAVEILVRAKAGEDFAKLANEFSEDPGNTNATGELQGGLYQNVKKGIMVPSFERAALALEAGHVSPELVESDYGFHIVKLERKGKSSGTDSAETYDVRHILISNGVAGADGRFIPMKEHVKSLLENEKEVRIIDDLVKANKISVPEDFEVPVAEAEAEPAKTPAPAKAPRTKPGSPRKRT